METPNKGTQARRRPIALVVIALLAIGGLVFVVWFLWPDDILTKEEMIEITSSPPEKYSDLVREVEMRCTHGYAWMKRPMAARRLKDERSEGNQIEAAERRWLKPEDVYWRDEKRYKNVEYIYEIMTISNPGSMTPRITSRWYFLVDKHDNLLGWHGSDSQDRRIVPK